MMAQRIKGLFFHSGDSQRRGVLADLLSPVPEKAATERGIREDFQKLRILGQHYGIAEDDGFFINLALALAREMYREPKKSRVNQEVEALGAIDRAEVARG